MIESTTQIEVGESDFNENVSLRIEFSTNYRIIKSMMNGIYCDSKLMHLLLDVNLKPIPIHLLVIASLIRFHYQ